MSAVEPAPDLPDLIDVMRLENAWVEAYHAEDAPVATIADLGALGPGLLPQAARHFSSRRAPPAVFNSGCLDLGFAINPAQTLRRPGRGSPRTCSLPVRRPKSNVRVLPPGGYDFATRLSRGATLLEAAQAADGLDFDFGAHLVGLVESGAVAALVPGGSC